MSSEDILREVENAAGVGTDQVLMGARRHVQHTDIALQHEPAIKPYSRITDTDTMIND